jgi:hypothetical protein
VSTAAVVGNAPEVAACSAGSHSEKIHRSVTGQGYLWVDVRD